LLLQDSNSTFAANTTEILSVEGACMLVKAVIFSGVDVYSNDLIDCTCTREIFGTLICVMLDGLTEFEISFQNLEPLSHVLLQ